MSTVRRIIHNNKSSHSIHPGDRFRIDIIIFLFELYSNSRLKLGLNKSHQIKKHGRNILIIFISNKNDLLFVFSRKFIRKQLGCHLTKCYRYWQAICSSMDSRAPQNSHAPCPSLRSGLNWQELSSPCPCGKQCFTFIASG